MAYPSFTLDYIENMTVEEYRWRMKAHGLKTVYDERLLYFLAFIQRATNAVEDDGEHYKFADLNEIIDLESAEAHLKGMKHTPREAAAQRKINEYRMLSERAKRAAELARQQFEKKGG